MGQIRTKRDAPIRQHSVLVSGLVEHVFLDKFFADTKLSLLCVLVVQLRWIVDYRLRDVLDTEQYDMNRFST